MQPPHGIFHASFHGHEVGVSLAHSAVLKLRLDMGLSMISICFSMVFNCGGRCPPVGSVFGLQRPHGIFHASFHGHEVGVSLADVAVLKLCIDMGLSNDIDLLFDDIQLRRPLPACLSRVSLVCSLLTESFTPLPMGAKVQETPAPWRSGEGRRL